MIFYWEHILFRARWYWFRAGGDSELGIPKPAGTTGYRAEYENAISGLSPGYKQTKKPLTPQLGNAGGNGTKRWWIHHRFVHLLILILWRLIYNEKCFVFGVRAALNLSSANARTMLEWLTSIPEVSHSNKVSGIWKHSGASKYAPTFQVQLHNIDACWIWTRASQIGRERTRFPTRTSESECDIL